MDWHSAKLLCYTNISMYAHLTFGCVASTDNIEVASSRIILVANLDIRASLSLRLSALVLRILSLFPNRRTVIDLLENFVLMLYLWPSRIRLFTGLSINNWRLGCCPRSEYDLSSRRFDCRLMRFSSSNTAFFFATPFAIFVVLSECSHRRFAMSSRRGSRIGYGKYIDCPFRLPAPDVSSERIQSSSHSSNWCLLTSFTQSSLSLRSQRWARCRCHRGYRGNFPIYLQISSSCLKRNSFFQLCPAACGFVTLSMEMCVPYGFLTDLRASIRSWSTLQHTAYVNCLFATLRRWTRRLIIPVHPTSHYRTD